MPPREILKMRPLGDAFSLNANHKDSSETTERIPEKQDLNDAYKLSKERRGYQGDKTWIFGGPENGE